MNNRKWCFSHKWSKWEYIGKLENGGLYSPDKLESTCLKCSKIREYIGLTNVCIVTGDKSPYIYMG